MSLLLAQVGCIEWVENRPWLNYRCPEQNIAQHLLDVEQLDAFLSYSICPRETFVIITNMICRSKGPRLHMIWSYSEEYQNTFFAKSKTNRGRWHQLGKSVTWCMINWSEDSAQIHQFHLEKVRAFPPPLKINNNYSCAVLYVYAHSVLWPKALFRALLPPKVPLFTWHQNYPSLRVSSRTVIGGCVKRVCLLSIQQHNCANCHCLCQVIQREKPKVSIFYLGCLH